jgi:hypothetical protein
MKPLAHHRTVACKTCGVTPGEPCKGERTCLGRIQGAIEMWWRGWHDETRQVACPITTCPAGVGDDCFYIGQQDQPYTRYGHVLSHKARIRIAERVYSK